MFRNFRQSEVSGGVKLVSLMRLKQNHFLAKWNFVTDESMKSPKQSAVVR